MRSWTAGIAGIVALAVIIAASYATLSISLSAGIVLSAVLGMGWPHYLGVPAKKTLGSVIALTGACASVTAALTPGPGYLSWLPVFLAVGVGAVFVVQLVRGTGQSHRLESTLGASAGVLLAGLGSGWIASHRFTGETAMTLIAGVSALVALLIGMIRWPDRVIAPLAIILAALAGPLAALLFSEVHIIQAAIIGAVIAAVLMSFRRLGTAAGRPRNVQGAIAMGIAPLGALGALVYFIDKLLIT
ncbi:permease [Paeniglutamicibacter antarcticus]|uniref:Permease n=1 Tax=Arthrobacter terrae TaxID=2935737 RepID=A0A931CU99_9MICC|nr:permease [Arthrobacter terrae]MBG0739973.1 permease [Arthrobacter terrae]